MFNYDDENVGKGTFIFVCIITFALLISIGILFKVTFFNKTKESEVVEPVIADVKDGKTPYEIACDNGFHGTEEEWNDSLNGGSGSDALTLYELALSTGFFKGSEEEFNAYLKGENGEDGDDSLSLFEYAKLNGYTGSEEDLITLLNAIKDGGIKGDDGEMGDTGLFVTGLNTYNILDGIYTYTVFEFILSDESVITKKIILPYAIASIDGIYPETLEKGVDITKVNIFANVTYTNGDTNNILLVDSFINDELYPNSNYSYIDTNMLGRYFVDVNIGGSFYEGIIEVVDTSTSSTNVKSISIEDDTNIIHSFTNDSLNEILFNTVLSNPVTVTFNDDSTIEFYPTLKMLSHDAPLSIYGNITTEGTYKVTLTMPCSDFKIDYTLNVYEKQEDAVKELEVDVDFEDGILTYEFLSNDMVEIYYSLTENKSLLFGYYSYTISGDIINVQCDDIPSKFNNDNGTLTVID